jgi:peptidoglycan/xylan/chitin deacetylase (PgdA/CDA1 family)
LSSTRDTLVEQLLRRAVTFSEPVLPICLAYHGFCRVLPQNDPHYLFVLESQFERQLALLARRRLHAVDLDGFLATHRSGGARRSYLLTVDDGYTSVLEIAAPILANRRHPALLFVSPALLGKETTPERIVSADELLELRRSGFEVGAHGLDHRELTGLSDEELRRQCAGAREHLGDILGTLPRAFSYPHGAFDTRACRAVAAAGYEVGFAVDRSAGIYALPRIGVYGRDSPAVFRVKLLFEQRGFRRMRQRASLLRRPTAGR